MLIRHSLLSHQPPLPNIQFFYGFSNRMTDEEEQTGIEEGEEETGKEDEDICADEGDEQTDDEKGDSRNLIPARVCWW